MNDLVRKYLRKEAGIAPLVTFRILFGALMALGMMRFWWSGWVDRLFKQPDFFFKYYGFEWVQIPEGIWIYLLVGISIVSALGIALGLFYRISAVLFFLSFTYIELLDATNYLNHYYLVVLFSAILIFLPANRKFSLDVKWRGLREIDFVPAISIDIIKVQMVVVYTFAGIAKLNPDWLFHAMPLKIWLGEYSQVPIVGPLLAWSGTAFIFSWFGALYDLSIGYFMLFQRTRKYAYVFVVLFHSATWMLFNIGLFPLIMMLSTTIFFSEKWHRKLLQKIGGRFGRTGRLRLVSPRFAGWVVGTYLFIQIVMPVRHFLYPGNVLVTEEGYRFSWRVMLLEKSGIARFKVVDGQTGRSLEVDNSMFLTPFQEKQMAIQPDFIRQYALYLAGQYKGRIKEPAVYVDSHVVINGRVGERLIDPEADLLSVGESFKPRNWVIAGKQNSLVSNDN